MWRLRKLARKSVITRDHQCVIFYILWRIHVSANLRIWWSWNHVHRQCKCHVVFLRFDKTILDCQLCIIWHHHRKIFYYRTMNHNKKYVELLGHNSDINVVKHSMVHDAWNDIELFQRAFFWRELSSIFFDSVSLVKWWPCLVIVQCCAKSLKCNLFIKRLNAVNSTPKKSMRNILDCFTFFIIYTNLRTPLLSYFVCFYFFIIYYSFMVW